MLERIKSWNESQTRMSWGLFFEYTAPVTPQQNGVVERAFLMVMGRARAMMNHAGFTIAKRQQLWCEAAQTATLLGNILIQDSEKSPLYSMCWSRCNVCQAFESFWRNVCCGRYR